MKIKIARIITRMDLGGAQEGVLSLSRGLSPDLFEQILITGEGGLLYGDLAAVSQVKKYLVPELTRKVGIFSLWMDLQAMLKIRTILRKEQPVMVHTHAPKAGIVGRWAAWAAAIPIIVHTYHGFGFGASHSFIKRLLYIWIEKLTAKITDQFVVVSRKNQERGEACGILRQSKSELIRSGIELAAFERPAKDNVAKKKEMQLSTSVRIVGTVAGFKPPKALHHLIRVAGMVSALEPNVKFLIVGDGELRPKLETLIRELHLESVVVLMGWRTDIPELLRTFDVFVLTSLWEGLPRVLVEARIAGLPVVAYDVDGVSEVIQTGENGFLVEPGDLKTMAQRIVELLRNETLRLKLGRVEGASLREFSVAEMLQKHSSLYLRLVEKVGRAPFSAESLTNQAL